MRILAEFSHPAQVHKFKYVFRELMRRGHQVVVLSRDKDVMIPLLDDLAIPHICLSRARSGLLGMGLELLQRELLVLWQALRLRPDVVFSAHSVAIAHVGWLLRIPTLVHEDTEFGTLQQRLYIPFASKVITSVAYTKDWGGRQVRIDSLEPLAYLHPDYFKPDPAVLEKYGLSLATPYAVMRFVAWKAAHDMGHAGPDGDAKARVLRGLHQKGIEKVVLTSESGEQLPFPGEVIRPEPPDLHHLMAFSKICVGDGITVANEAAVLGIPSVLWNPLRAGHTLELARYGLVRRVSGLEETLRVVDAILADADAGNEWKRRRERFLQEKVDMNEAMISLILGA
jgi:predicted glycosyltransferase